MASRLQKGLPEATGSRGLVCGWRVPLPVRLNPSPEGWALGVKKQFWVVLGRQADPIGCVWSSVPLPLGLARGTRGPFSCPVIISILFLVSVVHAALMFFGAASRRALLCRAPFSY